MTQYKKAKPASSRAAKAGTNARKGSNPAKRRPNIKNGKKKRAKNVKVPAIAAVSMAILVILMIAAIPLILHRVKTAPSGARVPAMDYSALGIDISHNNQGPIVWDSLFVMIDRDGNTVKDLSNAKKVLPVRFVFIKASEGVTMKDGKFREYWNEAGNRDIQRGAYHFFRSSKDGAAQARNFIAAVGDLRHSDLPPVLDIESIHRGCSRKILNERALQWLKTVEKQYGRKPLVYTSDSFARDFLSPEITRNYPVWIAHYDVDSPYFGDWEYWQFTDRAWVYGLPEPVDLSLRK